MRKRSRSRKPPSSTHACVYCGQFALRHLPGLGWVCRTCSDLPERDPVHSRAVTLEPSRHGKPR